MPHILVIKAEIIIPLKLEYAIMLKFQAINGSNKIRINVNVEYL